MPLFNFGNFKLASGALSPFKIDCDALTQNDIDNLAKLVASSGWSEWSFKKIIGVPNGGNAFAHALSKVLNVDPDSENPILLVDDVWTTGKTMREYKKKYEAESQVEGLVIFSRAPLYKIDLWVSPIFIIDIGYDHHTFDK